MRKKQVVYFSPAVKISTTVIYLVLLIPTLIWFFPLLESRHQEIVKISIIVLTAGALYYCVAYVISKFVFGRK